MATTWLITREADDARGERDEWTARGMKVVVVPCVETKILPWPWSGGDAGVPFIRESFPLTFFTSRRAVASWAGSSSPALGEVAALSPSTSAALEHEGLVPLITSGGGVVSLAQQVLAWWSARRSPPLQVRYPTSDAGLRSPEQAEALRLLGQLGEVDRRVAYAVAAPEDLRHSLEQAAQGEWAISFASPSAVQHFFAAGALFARPPVRVACLGAAAERTWNEARREGWPQAVNSRVFPPTQKVAS